MSIPTPFSSALGATALFFDFDGTLVELAATPEAIEVPSAVPARLAALRQAVGGALAIVSGRGIDSIDSFLALPGLPIAGLHGAERRDAQGALTQSGFDDARLADVVSVLKDVEQRHPGLLLELKRASVAFHYRNAPDCSTLVREAVEQASALHPGVYSVQPGKMVYELKPHGIDKGRAVEIFLSEPPFAGRVPVFAGDDLTDEAAFAVVQAMGGLAIKIGEGDTIARVRLPTVGALAQALDAWLADGQVRA
jgi:trehalose 6-phosphate phosphatase